MNAPTSFPASDLDEYVCWSRMQSEAGQTLEKIVARKERERRLGDGTFLWGVGNAPATVASVLSRTRRPVRAIFSIMKSRPKLVDASPSGVLAWRRYIDCTGVERNVPAHALVTSRADSGAGPKRTHYALMCHSTGPLALRFGLEHFDPSAFRNAGGTGAPVGNSQVTALLKRVDHGTLASDYEVNLSAWLTGSYWVRLTDPIRLTKNKHALLARLGEVVDNDWIEVVGAIRDGLGVEPAGEDHALLI